MIRRRDGRRSRRTRRPVASRLLTRQVATGHVPRRVRDRARRVTAKSHSGTGASRPSPVSGPRPRSQLVTAGRRRQGHRRREGSAELAGPMHRCAGSRPIPKPRPRLTARASTPSSEARGATGSGRGLVDTRTLEARDPDFAPGIGERDAKWSAPRRAHTNIISAKKPRRETRPMHQLDVAIHTRMLSQKQWISTKLIQKFLSISCSHKSSPKYFTEGKFVLS